jgi:Concanavalin A-like lectin/glucanases superfamily
MLLSKMRWLQLRRAFGYFVALALLTSSLQIVKVEAAVAAPSGIPGSIILGSGKYLSTADSADFVMGSSDFTFETWVHATSLPSTNYTGIISIGMPNDLTNGLNGHEIRIGQSFAGDGKLGFMAPDNTSTADVWTPTSSALRLGQWMHLALVRNGSTMTLYVNGIASATRTGVSFTHSGYPSKSGLGALFISKNGGWADGEFVGSVADVRLVKGTAVYTSDFTIPTSPLAVVGGSNTKILMNTNYSSSNTAADYAFNRASNAVSVSAGGTPASSAITPYEPLDTAINLTRASSMSGATDSTTPPLMNLAAYTVEGWIKPNAACIGAGIRCEAILRDGDYDIAISDGTFQLVIYYNGSQNTGWVNTTLVPQAGAWTHVALTRDGTAAKFYINGALAYSATLASALASNLTGYPFRIGYAGYGSTYFDGQIDEVKLWNVARTQAQIASTLYSAPSVSDTTLLAYYDFNTGNGTQVVNRKVGAAATSFITLTNSPTWVDVKVATTSGIDTTVKVPRAYINSFGGLELPSYVTKYDYLVVGGGGGGGNGYNNGGGGGGAGGMVLTGLANYSAESVLQAQVGVGGVGGANAQANYAGVAGDSSILGSVTAIGGGYGFGSRSYTNGFGGAKQNGSSAAAVGGNGGGAGGGGGGGGGAGGIGGNGSGPTPGNGGSGLSISIGSVTATFGAGAAGAQGSIATTGSWGVLNTGNGGGGAGAGSSASRAGGNGGTGMIIIHYSSGNTLTFSYSIAQPVYRTMGTITATSLTDGKVTFLERGKRIPNCINRPTNVSFVATCAWSPSTRGVVSVMMIFVANSGAASNATTTANVLVGRRTGTR